MEPDRIYAQRDRMLASSAFASADRSSRFLRYVIDSALSGRRDEIKESVIGIEVLGRGASFDPKTDPIVRVEAGRLRTRIASYYDTDGKLDTVLIALPKGGYVPEFSERQPPADTPLTYRPSLLRAMMLVASGTALGLLVAILGMRSLPKTLAVEGMKVSILPPAGVQILTSVISPDGRRIAFSGVLRDKQMLWLRDLDSLDAKPLNGTAGCAYPFWSADSRSIGFFGIDKMKRIDVRKGVAQDIAETQVPRGASWSAQNIIVFAPRPRGGLWQVAAAGGTPRVATVLDPERSEVAHSFPHFLPDGRHFVFLAISSRPGESSIRVGSLDGTSSKFLTNADGSPQYVANKEGSSGYLLFGLQGSLVAQPFSADNLKLTGVREVVAPEVLHVRGRADFSVSETGVLAYRGGTGKNHQLTWFDRGGRRLGDVGPLNNYYSWSLSPNEKSVAYQETAWTGALDTLWTLDLTRGVQTRFATGFELFLPIWSPDSHEILFSEGGDKSMTLRRQFLNSEKSIPAADFPGHKFPSDWSSDGKFVAYSRPSPDFRTLAVWIAELDGSAGQRQEKPFLAVDGAGGAQFAPAAAGQTPAWIAYVGNETQTPEVFVRDFPAGRQKWQVSPTGGSQPHWRGDGKELFYLTPDGALVSVEIRGHGTLDLSPPKRLFQTGLKNRRGVPDIFGQDYAPTKDGQRFLVNRIVGDAASTPITLVKPWPPATH